MLQIPVTYFAGIRSISTTSFSRNSSPFTCSSSAQPQPALAISSHYSSLKSGYAEHSTLDIKSPVLNLHVSNSEEGREVEI